MKTLPAQITFSSPHLHVFNFSCCWSRTIKLPTEPGVQPCNHRPLASFFLLSVPCSVVLKLEDPCHHFKSFFFFSQNCWLELNVFFDFFFCEMPNSEYALAYEQDDFCPQCVLASAWSCSQVNILWMQPLWLHPQSWRQVYAGLAREAASLERSGDGRVGVGQGWRINLGLCFGD